MGPSKREAVPSRGLFLIRRKDSPEKGSAASPPDGEFCFSFSAGNYNNNHRLLVQIFFAGKCPTFEPDSEFFFPRD